MSQTLYALAGDDYTTLLLDADTGQVGTYGVAVLTTAGAVQTAFTRTGVTEIGGGTYSFTGTAPADGTYIVRWQTSSGDTNGVGDDILKVGPVSETVPLDPGAAYFTATEARTASWMGGALTSTATYATADIDTMREAVEQSLEEACGVAFVPRTTTAEIHDGTGGYDLLTKWARPTAVTAATVNGAALTAGQLADLVVYPDGRIYNPSGWSVGRGNVTLTYTHGWPTVPGRVKRAAMLLTKRFLVDSPISDRATSMAGPDGTNMFLVTAGIRDNLYDIPEALAIVLQYGVGQAIG